MSCGYVGASDGWQDINAHSDDVVLPAADEGNIALTGGDRSGGQRRRVRARAGLRTQGSRSRTPGRAVVAAVFRASQRVRAGLAGGISAAATAGRTSRRSRTEKPDSHHDDDRDLYRISTAVLKVARGQTFPGGMIASLSIPWGASKGDDDLGGYHLVWPRDLVESAGGLLAAGDSYQRAQYAGLPDVHAGSRRALAAEYVAGRDAVLGRHPDGRNRVSDPAGRRSAPPGRAGRHRPVADGAPRRRVSGVQRPGHRAGSLGRRRRLLALHAGGRDRGTAGRG